ncbi:hypothetical protein P8452_37454 [Trifolium repens]|nr:hypothetical protein P8452_37454 [Trifolium repens]
MTKPHSLVAKIYKARWRIGSGDSINIMSEPWLREKNDAWIPSPQAQAKRIMETPLLSVVEDDKLIWGDSFDGKRTAFRLEGKTFVE